MANHPTKRNTWPCLAQIHPLTTSFEANLVDIPLDTLDAATQTPPAAGSTEAGPSKATTDATHIQTPSRGSSTVSGSSRSDESRTHWKVTPDPLRANPYGGLGCQQRNRPFCYPPMDESTPSSDPAVPGSQQYSSCGAGSPPDHALEGQPSSSSMTTPASPHQSSVHTATTKGYVALSPIVAARSAGSGVSRGEARLHGQGDSASCCK